MILGHHRHVTRIIHEFLLGPTNVARTRLTPKSAEFVFAAERYAGCDILLRRMLAKDRMRLYRHSSLCSTAMQLFLDRHPRYWCLVPRKVSEVERDDDDDDDDAALKLPLNSATRTDAEANELCDHLPRPMAGYQFSRRQRQQQWSFFKSKSDLIPLSVEFDLYHAAIVIVCKNQSR